MVQSLGVNFPRPSFLRVVGGIFAYNIHSKNTYVNHRKFKAFFNWEGIYVTIVHPASSYILLAYIFEASYSTVVTSSVSKKSSVDQSELEK